MDLSIEKEDQSSEWSFAYDDFVNHHESQNLSLNEIEIPTSIDEEQNNPFSFKYDQLLFQRISQSPKVDDLSFYHPIFLF